MPPPRPAPLSIFCCEDYCPLSSPQFFRSLHGLSSCQPGYLMSAKQHFHYACNENKPLICLSHPIGYEQQTPSLLLFLLCSSHASCSLHLYEDWIDLTRLWVLCQNIEMTVSYTIWSNLIRTLSSSYFSSSIDPILYAYFSYLHIGSNCCSLVHAINVATIIDSTHACLLALYDLWFALLNSWAIDHWESDLLCHLQVMCNLDMWDCRAKWSLIVVSNRRH